MRIEYVQSPNRSSAVARDTTLTTLKFERAESTISASIQARCVCIWRIEGSRVATAELLPIYTKLSQRIRGNASRRRNASGIRIVKGLESVWLRLRCQTHAWTWPRTNTGERFDGFDAHQTCHNCMSRRMFNTREWQAGPVYRVLVGPDAASDAYPASFGEASEPLLSSGYDVDWIRSRTT
jgi:hypothetical protein